MNGSVFIYLSAYICLPFSLHIEVLFNEIGIFSDFTLAILFFRLALDFIAACGC